MVRDIGLFGTGCSYAWILVATGTSGFRFLEPLVTVYLDQDAAALLNQTLRAARERDTRLTLPSNE